MAARGTSGPHARRYRAGGSPARPHPPADAVGYYRLLIHVRPLQDPATKAFRPGVAFADVLALYDFDRELRLPSLSIASRRATWHYG